MSKGVKESNFSKVLLSDMQFPVTGLITICLSLLLSCLLSFSIAERITSNKIIYFSSLILFFIGFQFLLSPIAAGLEQLLTTPKKSRQPSNSFNSFDPDICPLILEQNADQSKSKNIDDVFAGYKTLPQAPQPRPGSGGTDGNRAVACKVSDFNKRFARYAQL